MRAIGFLLLVLLLGGSCARREREASSGPQPVGGVQRLQSVLDAAERRADPQGAVLVVLWTTSTPPPPALLDVMKRWRRYGLFPVGVCVDLVRHGPREEALARVRVWERTHRIGIASVIYDGDADSLAAFLDGGEASASLTLLSSEGGILWSGEGFGGLEELEAILNVHLGEPSVAGADEGCICAVPRPSRDVTGREREARAG